MRKNIIIKKEKAESSFTYQGKKGNKKEKAESSNMVPVKPTWVLSGIYRFLQRGVVLCSYLIHRVVP